MFERFEKEARLGARARAVIRDGVSQLRAKRGQLNSSASTAGQTESQKADQ